MEKYLAHRAEDGREQGVLDHLEGTARRCAAFAAPFGAEEQGRLAGLAHDIGKYSDAFQRRLLGGAKVDHATAGAEACARMGQICAAFAVAGHHGGLPDGGGKTDHHEGSTFWARMNRAKKGKLAPCGRWKEEVSLPQAALPPRQGGAEEMFFIRMLYSCLVDADYLDTEAFMTGAAREENAPADMAALEGRLGAYTARWFPPKGALNARRCAILERCREEGARRAPGLYTLTVPTGGGKTVSSLAFALAQARARGLRRVVYVIPYTAIIEQTAQTFREILGEEAVLEHHSGVVFDTGEKGELTPAAERMARATETWDVPVVVTTAVQFFESLFASRPSQCRKLHNLAGSVILLDEAQMLPLPYLRPCVWAIAQLVQHYGASALLCTATQPALGPIFRAFAPQLAMEELCPMGAEEWDAFRRVTFRRAGKLTWEALAAELQGRDQVLCVVNSRKAAREVFQRLTGEGKFHLSTLMYPAHRRAALEEVRRRLKDGLPCRVVSTSLIEAGVDVDFPAVFREEAGLDSILQAAGRCNREGKRSPADSAVTIFQGEDRPPKLFETAIETGRAVLDRFEDVASREAVHTYFQELLDLKGEEAQDREEILPRMEREFYPFRTVAERFRLIDSPTVTVYIPEGGGTELTERLRAGERSRSLFRRLGQYGVPVYQEDLAALDRAGAVERLEDGLLLLARPDCYSGETGLSTEGELGVGHIL